MLPDPAKRTLRCGPFVDGVCQKCGYRDHLDLLEYEGEKAEQIRDGIANRSAPVGHVPHVPALDKNEGPT